jgi:NAD(P)-dependent dehydrogenase (short-subunit alcohol dehydrogenase family)
METDNREFSGRTVLVTGGGTGLGRATAIAFASAGASVAIFSRSMDHLGPVAEELRALGATALPIAGDVRSPEEVEAAAQKIEEELGAIDVLVNNAAGNFLIPAEELTPNGFRSVVEIVLHGTWFCSSVVGRRMLARHRGSIVNVVATYAETGMPGVVHSAAAKAGVLSITRTLAAEWGSRGIRVNAIAPGIMVTEGAAQNLHFTDEKVQERLKRQIPARRFATLEEIADAILYLASARAAYITGDCLYVDGGLSLPSGFGIVPPR